MLAQFLMLGSHALLQHRLHGAQLHVHAVALLLQVVQLRGGAHIEQQRFRMPGLEDVLVDTRNVDARDDVLDIGIAGNDHAHRIRPALAHFNQKIDAGHPGHAMVAQHHLHRLALHDRAAVLGAGSGEHGKFFFQRAAQGLLRTHFVIDHQNGGQ